MSTKTDVDILEVIRSRRSIGKVRPDPVPRDLVEQLLEAAVQAPNHHLTLPWRFCVLTGEARADLGDLMAAGVRASLPDPESDEGRFQLERASAKAFRAPVIVVAGVHHETEDPVVRHENALAGAAAVQNLLLAAHALGLGAMWRTGLPAYDPAVKAHFGLDQEDDLIGFVYVGYPAIQAVPRQHSYEDRTEWRGWSG